MGSPGAESRAGQAFVGWPVIADHEQVRGAALPAASSPLRRRAERTGAAGGGERDRLVAGGNSGELDRRLPEGCVVGRERSGRGGESGRAVTQSPLHHYQTLSRSREHIIKSSTPSSSGW